MALCDVDLLLQCEHVVLMQSALGDVFTSADSLMIYYTFSCL